MFHSPRLHKHVKLEEKKKKKKRKKEKKHESNNRQRDLSVQDADYKSSTSYACQKS